MKSQEESRDIQKIPTSFPSIKLKFGVDRQTDKFESPPKEVDKISLSMVESWTGKIIQPDDDGESISAGLVKFNEGDVLFSKLRPYLAKSFVACSKGAGSPEFLVLRPSKFDAHYLHYLLVSSEFIERVDTSTYGARMPRASWNFIGNIKVPYPDESKQREIASFLNDSTTYIDTLIDKMKNFRELFEERRESNLMKEITNGADRSTEMKDLSVPWIEDIPDNWEVRKLKWCVQEAVAGPYGSSLTKSMYTDTGPRVYGQQEVIGDNFDATDYRISPEKFQDMSRYQVCSGDLLVSVMGTIGEVSVVPPSAEKGIINPRLVKYVIDESVALPEFIKMVLLSDGIQAMLQKKSNGSTMEGLNMKILGNLSLPIPPISEQKIILNSINKANNVHEKCKNKISQVIDLLHERRRTIITKTVIGDNEIGDYQQKETQSPL